MTQLPVRVTMPNLVVRRRVKHRVEPKNWGAQGQNFWPHLTPPACSVESPPSTFFIVVVTENMITSMIKFVSVGLELLIESTEI